MMPRMHRRRLLVSCLLALPLVAALAVAGPAVLPARVVAVGDVHGAVTEFVAILQSMNLVDANRRWSGGRSTLVQTGDILDRGARAREALDLAMEIERQAKRAGGAFIPLLGNHEAMNAMGDLRYVTPEIYRTFATARSEQVRGAAFREYAGFLRAHAGHAHGLAVPADEAGRKKWMDDHALGSFEYRDAMGPDGRYGRWIRRHPAAVQVGDGLFVHGGLNPALPFDSAAAIDRHVHAELDGFDRLWRELVRARLVWRYMTLRQAVAFLEEEQKWMQAQAVPPDPANADRIRKLLAYREWNIASSDGPLWYRGLVKEVDASFASALDARLARFGARYVVVGHTVQSKATVTPWIGGRVFAIDTGMLPEEYKGRASALEIKDGRFTVSYADGTTQAMPAPAPLPVKAPIS
jgi:hypothetical protein